MIRSLKVSNHYVILREKPSPNYFLGFARDPRTLFENQINITGEDFPYRKCQSHNLDREEPADEPVEFEK